MLFINCVIDRFGAPRQQETCKRNVPGQDSNTGKILLWQEANLRVWGVSQDTKLLDLRGK